MAEVFFTADTHFGHAKVIRYSRRPFASLDEMDAELVRRWNDVVGKADRVYVLGDFSFYKNERTREIIAELRGQIHLVTGNHDGGLNSGTRELFASCAPYKEIRLDGQKIILFHFAMLTWNEAHHGSWHLHGHSHGTLNTGGDARRVDVGVDCWMYSPISFPFLRDVVMPGKWFAPVDHHEEHGEVE